MSKNKVHFYTDAKGEHRWRYVARNGRTLADSGEGYEHLGDCLAAWGEVHEGDVVEVHDDLKALREFIAGKDGSSSPPPAKSA